MKRDPIIKLLSGLGSGVAFGFLLGKSGVARHETFVDQLLLRRYDALKVMGSAAAVGAAGIYFLRRFGMANPAPKPMKTGGVVFGALTFGTGMAISGYCPGTSLAALGAGRRDARATVLGMLVGAAAFVRLYPRLAAVLRYGDLGPRTLPDVTHTRVGPWVGALALTTATTALATSR